KPRAVWRLGVGRTLQITQTFVSMTVRENVQMALISHHHRTRAMLSRATNLYRDDADALLARVGMEPQAPRAASELAYGDLKRLELAIALAHAPKVLLMDEPTAGMSRADTNNTIDLLKRIGERGITMMIIEHDMHVVFSLADKISVLAQGTVIAEDLPENIKGNPKVQEAYLGGAHL
ncbi:MAG: ATP-binding cassette domain-containing protein, partial [Pseudomonadota bacterium]